MKSLSGDEKKKIKGGSPRFDSGDDDDQFREVLSVTSIVPLEKLRPVSPLQNFSIKRPLLNVLSSSEKVARRGVKGDQLKGWDVELEDDDL